MSTQNNNNDAPQSPPRHESLDIFRANTPTEPHGLPLPHNMPGFNWVPTQPEPSSPSKTIVKEEEEEEEKSWLRFGPRPDTPNFGAWKIPDWSQTSPQHRERTPVSPKTVGKCGWKLNLPKQREVRKCRMKLNLPPRPVEPHISKPPRQARTRVKKEEKEKRKRPKLTLKMSDLPKPRLRLVLRLREPDTGEFIS
jgi:hypothetical protein